MFFEILASILFAIRNIVVKDLPDIGVISLSAMVAIVWGIIGVMFLPFTEFKQNVITKELLIYSTVSLMAQISMQHAFIQSSNVAITAALLSLNIIFTLVLESLISKKIKATKKQLFSLLLILTGTILSK